MGKYEEALERAKQGMPIDEVFPELKESEDERIRKWIVAELQNSLNEIYAMYSGDYDNRDAEDKQRQRCLESAIAWLEKQKENPITPEQMEEGADAVLWGEQKPASGYIYPRFKVGDTLCRQGWVDHTVEKIYFCSEPVYVCKSNEGLESHISLSEQNMWSLKQKPAEWSEDNIKELTEFEAAMLHIGMSFWGSAGLNPNNTNEVKKQAKLLLELVPKQEWSEEDEKMRIKIMSFLSSRCSVNDYKEIEDWLKSLRPQPHWKPSDGQMRTLNNVIKCELSAGMHTRAEILQTLQNDLKKLF